MNDDLIGRTLRALRHRRGWRQSDLAAAAGVARSVIGDLEAGRLDGHDLGALRRSIHATGAVLRLVVDVPGGELRRLLDADHARLQAHWLEALRRNGWYVEPEVTFSVYGERGSIDLLAWHPTTRTLLVIELKTVIVDIGSLLGVLDRKTRLAPSVARERGWRPSRVVPALLILDGSTARRRLVEHAPLFSRFELRGRSAVAWMRHPDGIEPSGVLAFAKLPDARLATVDAPVANGYASDARHHARLAGPRERRPRPEPSNAVRTGRWCQSGDARRVAPSRQARGADLAMPGA